MSNQNECTCTVCLGVYDNNLIDGVYYKENGFVAPILRMWTMDAL